MSGNPGNEEQNPAATSTSEQAANQEIDYKAEYEKANQRRKDTQAAYTKGQQALKAEQAKVRVLQEQVGKTPVSMSPDKKIEMDSLMLDNPQAWRTEMNKLEQEAAAEIDAKLVDASQAGTREAELNRRQQVLVDFNTSHPDKPITDELMAADIPPRITKKLESGDITFEAYLEEVSEYIYKPKVVGDGQTVAQQPNLGAVGGGSQASDAAKAANAVNSYDTELY